MVGTKLVVRLFLYQPALPKVLEDGGQAREQASRNSGISCGCGTQLA
jgi:hypothetical protein